MTKTKSLIVYTALIAIAFTQEEPCIDGTYGDNCGLSCSPTCGAFYTYPCDRTTGKCTEGCQRGYHGPQCNLTCNCSGECMQQNGDCLEENTPETARTHRDTNESTCNWGVATTTIFVLISVALSGCLIFIYYRYVKNGTNATPGDCFPSYSKARVYEEDCSFASSDQEKALLGKHRKSEDYTDADVSVHDLKKRIEELQEELTLQRKRDRTESLTSFLVDLGLSPDGKYHLLDETSLLPLLITGLNLAYDRDTVNCKQAQISSEQLVNKPVSPNGYCTKRLRKYSGTTTLNQITPTGCKQYLEVATDITMDKAFEGRELLLEIGFCPKEKLDAHQYTPEARGCFCLQITHCPKHKSICSWVFHDGRLVVDEIFHLRNEPQSSTKLEFGIVLDITKKTVLFVDLKKKRKITLLREVDFSKPLWPLFGVFGRYNAEIKMKLIPGSEVHLPNEKLEMLKEMLKPDVSAKPNKKSRK